MSSGRRRGLLSLVFTLALLPALAPAALAAVPLSLTTPYPSVTVSPGTRVSFDLSVTTNNPARVDLALSGVPSGWTATLHGGGYVVGAAQTNGTDPTTVRLDVEVSDTASGTSRITVTATGNGTSAALALDIKVEAKAGGEVTVTPDFTGLKGASGTAFKFNLTVHNGKDTDLTFNGTGTAPDGWTVDVVPTGQAQAVTATVKAGSTANLAVTVNAPDAAPANTYPIVILVTIGDQQIEQDLAVEVTGTFGLTLNTPDGLLSAHGPSGSVTDQTFVITNTGTAPLTNVALSASPPNGWKVEFDTPTIETLAAGQTINVIAHVTPSGNAIAGDYQITVRVTTKEAKTDSSDIRFTVETSIVGALLGLVLILAAIGGLWWVFRTYGRR